MHILLLPSWYATKQAPMNGSFFREQAIALAKHSEHRVSLLAVVSDAEGPAYTEEYDDQGVHTIVCHFRAIRGLGLWQTRRHALRLFQQYFANDLPSIVHVHSFSACDYARRISRRYGIPYVVTEHSSAFARGLMTGRRRRLAMSGFRDAARVLAVSSGLAARLAPFFPGSITVVSNMVNDTFFSQELTSPAPNGFRFISIGYLNKNKGMDRLIEGFAPVARAHPETRLILCGGGEEETSLKRQASDLGIAARVAFLGTVDRDEIVRQLSRAHAFALASRTETFGVSAIEALACGKPVIMTDTDAAKTIVHEGNGYVVPVDDAAALSGAMERMITEYSRFEPSALREDCRRRFSEQAVCRRLMEIYGEILGDPSL